MQLMLEVLMCLGFVAYRLIFFQTKHAYGPDKAVYPAPLCHLHLAPSLHQIHFHSLPAPLPCRLQAPAWLEIGQSGL